MAYRNPSMMQDALRSTARPLTAPSFRPPASGTTLPTAPPPEPVVQGGSPGLDPAGAAPAAGVADGSTGPAKVPDYQNSNENLAMWGYTGEIPINNIEQQAIDFVNQMYGSGGGLETMSGAGDYYRRVLAGEFGPEGQQFLSGVLDPMRERSARDYQDMSKALATKFSNYGGFFGGKHGVAQGRLAAESANNQAQTEANLRYQGFMDNMNRMGGAAGGLVGLGQAQSGVSGDMLNYLLSTGGMVTGRDALNRSEYQGALQRSYNDWLRARQERLMPFTMGSNLIGQQATQPIVTQTQSPWGAALGAIGSIGGGLLGNPRLFS